MYLTVVNKFTRQSVPFNILPNGEIMIISTDPSNNEDTCEVRLTNLFYTWSKDFHNYYEKVGVNG